MSGVQQPTDGARAEPRRLTDAIHRFQKGRGAERERAFRTIHDAYFRPLQSFFARRGASPEDALELTQETFLRIFQSLDGYEHRERFAAWLFQVAKTMLLKRHRRATTAKRSGVEVSRDAVEHPDGLGESVPGRQLGSLIDRQRTAALRGALDELPDQMRDCLTLRLYHDLSYREIARVKTLSVDTVKSHLYRARQRLEERLSDLDLGGPDD
jgi:RNA polymerase sigma-70 factor (ECF subfamily)